MWHIVRAWLEHWRACIEAWAADTVTDAFAEWRDCGRDYCTGPDDGAPCTETCVCDCHETERAAV